MSLVKSQVGPTGQYTTDNHGRFCTVDKADEPKQQWNDDREQWNIAVGNATGRRIQHSAVGHDLFDGYGDASQISGQTANVHREQQFRIPGEHVQDVIENGTGQRHTDIDDGEKHEYLKFTPQRLDEFTAHGHYGYVEQHLPQVRLEETERERRPQPKRRRKQIARRYAEHRRALRPKREQIAYWQKARYDFDAQPCVVEQQFGVLLDVWQVFTYIV